MYCHFLRVLHFAFALTINKMMKQSDTFHSKKNIMKESGDLDRLSIENVAESKTSRYYQNNIIPAIMFMLTGRRISHFMPKSLSTRVYSEWIFVRVLLVLTIFAILVITLVILTSNNGFLHNPRQSREQCIHPDIWIVDYVLLPVQILLLTLSLIMLLIETGIPTQIPNN
jgi:hypothetical protein